MVNTQEMEEKFAPDGVVDIFISYASEDRLAADMLVKALEKQGWSVWFDARISAGAKWDKAIEAALGSARCVVVIWSAASVQSDWVRAEAESARERGVVFPVRITNVRPPIVFRAVQTPSLLGWEGNTSHPGFIELTRGIATLLGKPRSSEPSDSPKRPFHPRASWLLIGLFVLPITAIIVLNLTNATELSISLDATVSQLDATLDADSEILDFMVLSDIGVSGIQEIQFPRQRTEAGRQRQAYTAQSDRLILRTSTRPQLDGSITLEPISAQTGTRLQFKQRLNSNELGISLDSLREPIRINVMGNIAVQLPPTTHYISDFGSPKPVMLLNDGRAADLALTLVTAPLNWLSTPLPIRQVAFVRIDEKNTLTASSVVEVSTIISGMIQIESLENWIVTLRPRELIRFGKVKGHIMAISQGYDGINLKFVGTTVELEKCIGTICQNEMPSRWQLLRRRHPFSLYAAVAVYVLGVIAFLIKPWRRKPRG